MMLRHYFLARDPMRPRLRTRTDERMRLYDRTLSVSLLASAMKAGRPRGPGPLRFTRTQAPRQACHVRKNIIINIPRKPKYMHSPKMSLDFAMVRGKNDHIFKALLKSPSSHIVEIHPLITRQKQSIVSPHSSTNRGKLARRLSAWLCVELHFGIIIHNLFRIRLTVVILLLLN